MSYETTGAGYIASLRQMAEGHYVDFDELCDVADYIERQLASHGEAFDWKEALDLADRIRRAAGA